MGPASFLVCLSVLHSNVRIGVNLPFTAQPLPCSPSSALPIHCGNVTANSCKNELGCRLPAAAADAKGGTHTDRRDPCTGDAGGTGRSWPQAARTAAPSARFPRTERPDDEGDSTCKPCWPPCRMAASGRLAKPPERPQSGRVAAVAKAGVEGSGRSALRLFPRLSIPSEEPLAP